MGSIRKKAVCSLLFLLLTVLSGCKSETAVCEVDSGYICVKMDPNASQVFMTVVLPQLDAMHKQTIELMSQHKWFRDSLDRCIKAIEIEKGLEPIPLSIKYPLPLKRDPNQVNEYTPGDEPLFMPYESLDVKPLGGPNNIHILRALLNLQLVSLNLYMADANERIENFEKRLKRLSKELKDIWRSE